MRDGEIREALLRHLHARFVGDRIREEMGLCLGATRADVVVINGRLHGYEIKSDRDTLDRFRKQIDLYGQVLDISYVVASGKHVNKVLTLTPAWWGVIEAYGDENNVRLSTVRVGCANPSPEPYSICQLLWRDEVADVFRDRGEPVRKRETRWNLWDRLAALPLIEIQEIVRARLKARPLWPGG